MVGAGSQAYRGGSRQWRQARHAESVAASLVRHTGSAVRPRHLAVRLSDGRTAFSQTLTAPLPRRSPRSSLGRVRPAGRAPAAETGTGRAVAVDALVEVLAGKTRHAVVTVTRNG